MLKQIKIAHEAPKSIFRKVQECTDYDYALVHLFEEDPEYLQMFQTALIKGREVILDNSIFELGEAFDMGKFAEWINILKPTYYIVPDSLEDTDGTMSNMEKWIREYEPYVPRSCKKMGVVQGKSYPDLQFCYEYMTKSAKVDKVAISFDYSYYEESVPHPNKLISWALGRVKLLGDFRKSGVLCEKVRHHLLGCGTPGEGLFYSSGDFDFIDSVDTSNPVLHGCLGIEYNGPLGLTEKNSTKLFTIMNEEINLERWRSVLYNIREFRKLWGGKYGVWRS